MSKFLQSGQHPDADLLNAFVERSLPAHEQDELLVHLAVCPDCRAIVTLSMPDPDESPTPAIMLAPVGKPWFRRWNFVWAPTLAFASFALILGYLHNQRTTEKSVAAPIQTAAERVPEPIPAQQASRAQPSIAPSPAVSAAKSRQAGKSLAGPGVTASANNNRPNASQSAVELPMAGRNFAALTPMAKAPSPAPPASQGSASGAGTAPGTGGGFGHGQAVGGMIVQSVSRDQAAVSPSLPPLKVNESAPQPAPAPAGQLTLSAAQAAPAPPVPTSNFSSKSITATSSAAFKAAAAPADSTAIGAGGLTLKTVQNSTLQSQHLQSALPSHLTVLSAVTKGAQILAIDTRNALFLSTDGGLHWKPVHPQWAGRAVKVALVTSAPSTAPSASALGSASAFSPSATQIASLTGAVTDATGAAIAGATVIAANSAVTLSDQTDATGHYAFTNLPAGVYSLEARSPGFESKSLANQDIHPSANPPANFTLSVGASSETVEVTADAMSVTTPRAIARKHAKAEQSTPIFEITTDTGQLFTSTDGQVWSQKK